MRVMEEIMDKEFFDQISADFSEEVRKTLWDLLQDTHINETLVVSDNCQLRFEVNMGASCVRYLTLYEVTGVPNHGDVFEFRNFAKMQNGYTLFGEVWSEETEAEEKFGIHFSDASVELHPFRADILEFEGSPWRHLSNAALQIYLKYEISANLLNEGEKELLPLLVDLAKLWCRDDFPSPWEEQELPALKSYLREQGYDELASEVQKVERDLDDFRIATRLFIKLDRIEYEPLFRSIWNKVKATQAQYPTEAEVSTSLTELLTLRKQVTEMMYQLGYSGTYPDFCKTGEFKGIRLVEHENVEQFVFGSKNAAYHIHFEERAGNSILLQILCGTQLFKKKQEPGDILSCMFSSNGRTFVKIMFCSTEEPENLEAILPIADKQAQLIKLTREDRERILDYKESSLKVFLFSLICGGGLFALLFTPAIFGLDALFCFLDQEPMTFSLMLWLQIFLFSWIGFGGLVGGLVALFNHMK